MFTHDCFITMALLAGALAAAAPLSAGTEVSCGRPLYNYTLAGVFEVKGRQGVVSDGDYYYVSGSKGLYKYDKKGRLVQSNETPFEGYPIPVNHIGGIDVFNGEIFVSAENFMDGAGRDIQIGVHDAGTLKLKRAFAFEPSSGQEEVSGLCVDTVRRAVWMTSWVGGESGLSDPSLIRYADALGTLDGEVLQTPDFAAFIDENRAWLADADALAIVELRAGEDGALLESAAKAAIAGQFSMPILTGGELSADLNSIRRGASALLNGQLMPILYEFLSAMKTALAARHIGAPIAIVRSDGSLMS
ncbi:MAG: hypothetical protein LBM92_04095, partial [Opitutaceae bacterium]|nr:hypothetical protein [Opitutaceae bacterium]